MAAQLYRLGHPFGSQDEVAFVLAFVQQVITYRSEEGEYPRYPVETLWEGGGDCEDYSILGAAILLSMGYQVALLLLPRHAALGVAGADGLPGVYAEHEGVRYFYCEMTGESWRFGELPPDPRVNRSTSPLFHRRRSKSYDQRQRGNKQLTLNAFPGNPCQ